MLSEDIETFFWAPSTCFGSETRKFKMTAAYGKCSKISKTFLILFSNKTLVIRAGIHTMLVRIANREDPDQTV